MLEFAPTAYTNDPSLVARAIAKDRALLCVSGDQLRRTRSIIDAAVRSSPYLAIHCLLQGTHDLVPILFSAILNAEEGAFTHGDYPWGPVVSAETAKELGANRTALKACLLRSPEVDMDIFGMDHETRWP